MNSSNFNLILKVKDLVTERAFYRDVVGLGQPVMDSNFWVEFSAGSSFSICLEQLEETDSVPVTGNQIAWTVSVAGIDSFLRRMQDRGYSTEDAYPCEKFGLRMYAVKDPEGNRFYVSDNTPIE